MTGSENNGIGSGEVAEPLSAKSYASSRSAMSSLSETHHPLSSPMVTTPADFDPLLSPPQPSSPPRREVRTPNGSDRSFLDPPSYADAIFSSLEEDLDNCDNGFENPKPKDDSEMPSPSTSSEYINITVTNPQKEQEASKSIVPGGNTHVSYLITTKTNMPEFGRSEFGVRRRFKEVVTLSERLSESFRGYFVPPRPDKNVVEAQVMHKQEFVELRRVALEKYLRRLAAHPVIRKSEELRVFLQVQGQLPLPVSTDVASQILDGEVKLPKQLFRDSAGAVAANEAGQPAKGGRDLWRLFREFKQSVAFDWGGSSPQVAEEDKEFLDKKEKLHDLEQKLSNVSQQAESFVKAQQDLGETMGELGLAFIKLTKFENEAAVLNCQRARAAEIKNLAISTVKASRLWRGLNANTVEHMDTLHEYLGLILAADSAFSDRSSALLRVQTLTSELSSLHAKLDKLEPMSSKVFGGDKTRIQKIEDLKEAIRVTGDAKQRAVNEYEQIKENNRSELGRFDRGKRSDFLDMLKGVAKTQVTYAEKIGNIWEQIAEETRGYANGST